MELAIEEPVAGMVGGGVPGWGLYQNAHANDKGGVEDGV